MFQETGDLIETLLCARVRPGYHGEDAPLTWRLPKGTPERGETVEQTARREVQEETGVHVNVLAPITSIRYFFVGHDDGIRYDKTVYFYLMEPMGGSTSDHDTEFDVVEWCNYDEAVELPRIRQRARGPGSGPLADRFLPARRGAMSKDLVLRGVRVLLRGKRMEDAENDYIWRSDPEIARLDAAYPLTMKYERYLKLFQDQVRWPTPRLASLRHRGCRGQVHRQLHVLRPGQPFQGSRAGNRHRGPGLLERRLWLRRGGDTAAPHVRRPAAQAGVPAHPGMEPPGPRSPSSDRASIRYETSDGCPTISS